MLQILVSVTGQVKQSFKEGEGQFLKVSLILLMGTELDICLRYQKDFEGGCTKKRNAKKSYRQILQVRFIGQT